MPIVPNAPTVDGDMQVVLVDTADCLSPDDFEPADARRHEFLGESLRRDGQRVPVLLTPSREHPGKFDILDGLHRRDWLHRLGRKLRAVVLDRPVSEAERIELKFTHNVLRRSMSLEEIALEASRYIEVTGCSQNEAARKLKCSDATISKALTSARRIPPEYREAARRLGPSFVALATSLKTPEAIRRAFEFALAADEDGKRPTRDELTRFVKELKGKDRPKTAKPKRLRLRVDDRRFEVELKSGDSTESLLEAFRALIARLARHRELPLDAVAAILADREPSAA